MNRPVNLLIVALALVCVATASIPVASVSSTESYTLNGHSVFAPGVASWPAVLGDEIASSAAPAVILFQDGSRVSLAPKSTVRISGTVAEPILLLLNGSIDYRLVKGSKVSLAKLQTPDHGAKNTSTTYSVTSYGTTKISPMIVATAASASIAAPLAVLLVSGHLGNAGPLTAVASPISSTSGAVIGSATTASSTSVNPGGSGATSGSVNTSTPALGSHAPPISHFQ